MIISVAAKARMRKNCKEVSREMYIRCRLIGSCAVWFWLAKIIRGSNQHDSTRSGVERGSVARYGLRKDHPVSDEFFSHDRLMSAINRLWSRVVGHSHLVGVNQAVGISIIVGMRIFSIGGDLGLVGDRSRAFVRWLL